MGDLQTDTVSEVHCLECGADLPLDAARCDQCGNRRLILPSRWTPPGEGKKEGSARTLRLGEDARVLVGLSLALFCALALLGGARERMDARLAGASANNMQLVVEKTDSSISRTGVEPKDTSIGIPEADIATLRASAAKAEESGAWFDVVDDWTAVTNHPDAALKDFLALADAQERVQNDDAAVHSLNRGIVRFPDKPDGYLALGSLRERMGNWNAARVQYSVGLSFCPTDKKLAEALSQCEKSMGIASEELPELIDMPAAPESAPDDSAKPDNGWTQVNSSGLIPWTSLVHPAAESHKTEAPAGKNPTTLIGSDQAPTPTSASSESGHGGSSAPVPSVEVRDVDINATSDKVMIEFLTSGTVEMSSRSADNPPRLIIRLPNARIAPGAKFPTSIALNVPLADRVAIIQGSDDSIMTVILVVYFGADARWSVGSDSRAIRVTITKAPDGLSGGVE